MSSRVSCTIFRHAAACSGMHATCLYTDIGTCLKVFQHGANIFGSLTEGLGNCSLSVLNAITSQGSNVTQNNARRHMTLKAKSDAVSAAWTSSPNCP
jgi:hypothetical protein